MKNAIIVALLVSLTAPANLAFGQLNWPAATEIAPINLPNVVASCFTASGEVLGLTATTIEVFPSVNGGTPTTLTVSGVDGIFRRIAATENWYWITTSTVFARVDKATGVGTVIWALPTDDVVANWSDNTVWVCRSPAGQIRQYLEDGTWWDTQNTGDPRAVGIQQGSLRWVSGGNPTGISFDDFGYRLGTNVTAPTGIQVRNAQGIPQGFLPNTEGTTTCNRSVSIWGSYAIATEPSTGLIRVWDEGTVLPVTWLTFFVKATDRFVTLDWSTASEKDNEGFAVERSTDGINYEEIGYLDGAGTVPSAINNYQFVDHFPIKGLAYYRLKQEDWDGQFSYSIVRTVEFGVPSIKIFPNPCADWATVENVKEEDVITLYNINGQIVLQDVASSETHTFQTASLDAGLYFVSVNSGAAKRLRVTH